MDMKITKETVQYLAGLVKLDLSEGEIEQAKEELSDAFAYFSKLQELDSSGVKAMSHVLEHRNVFREDVVTNGDDRENILRNAPGKQEGSFLVPKTYED